MWLSARESCLTSAGLKLSSKRFIALNLTRRSTWRHGRFRYSIGMIVGFVAAARGAPKWLICIVEGASVPLLVVGFLACGAVGIQDTDKNRHFINCLKCFGQVQVRTDPPR